MILFFSGTGNSRFAAEIIAEINQDELVSINELLKQGTPDRLESFSKPYVIVCPAYAWRIPRVVEDFIKKTDFAGRNDVYLIMTCGEDTANAVGYFKRLCKEKGFDLKGFAEIVMPDNYIMMLDGIDKEAADVIVQKAVPMIEKIAVKIKDNSIFLEYLPKKKMNSSIGNILFYPLFVKASGFYATEKCTGCGRCELQCSLNNINIRESGPHWGNRCTHCMGCICGCPAEAIEYRKKTKGKPRYYLNSDRLD